MSTKGDTVSLDFENEIVRVLNKNKVRKSAAFKYFMIKNNITAEINLLAQNQYSIAFDMI